MLLVVVACLVVGVEIGSLSLSLSLEKKGKERKRMGVTGRVPGVIGRGNGETYRVPDYFSYDYERQKQMYLNTWRAIECCRQHISKEPLTGSLCAWTSMDGYIFIIHDI